MSVPNGAYLRDIVHILKEPMATEAHGKHGIFTDNFLCLPWIPWLLITISILVSAIHISADNALFSGAAGTPVWRP
jgi:hypothetical protein